MAEMKLVRVLLKWNKIFFIFWPFFIWFQSRVNTKDENDEYSEFLWDASSFHSLWWTTTITRHWVTFDVKDVSETKMSDKQHSRNRGENNSNYGCNSARHQNQGLQHQGQSLLKQWLSNNSLFLLFICQNSVSLEVQAPSSNTFKVLKLITHRSCQWIHIWFRMTPDHRDILNQWSSSSGPRPESGTPNCPLSDWTPKSTRNSNDREKVIFT